MVVCSKVDRVLVRLASIDLCGGIKDRCSRLEKIFRMSKVASISKDRQGARNRSLILLEMWWGTGLNYDGAISGAGALATKTPQPQLNVPDSEESSRGRSRRR